MESKIYTVKILNAGLQTKSGRTYTEQHLREAAKTLCYRPLNINHSQTWLPFPENAVLEANWNPHLKALMAEIQISDPSVRRMIESGEIRTVSAEVLWKGDRLAAFTGLALVTADSLPVDRNSKIY